MIASRMPSPGSRSQGTFRRTLRARLLRDACVPKECSVQKKGDRYLEVDPWRIVEKGFHADQGRVSESLFSLSNENIGFRGSFEETYSGDTLQGAYFNGLYEEHVQEKHGYRGISNRLCFMVNCPHALQLRVSVGNEELDLAK